MAIMKMKQYEAAFKARVALDEVEGEKAEQVGRNCTLNKPICCPKNG
ncbi:MAG: hypothetical protein H5U06_00640 [Candidatus Aminicenantes bacterium]|nr:hypothetical protein [Candidatus Aminicenantes bacterium]